MLRRNILFIYPPTNSETVRGLGSNLLNGSAVSPEISFLYLEAYTKAKIPGIEVAYVDFRIDDPNKAETILGELLGGGHFGIVGITCYSCHYLTAMALARLVKQIDKDIVTIVGGFHPTICPQDFTFPSSPVDIVIRGEAEVSLCKLLRDEVEPARSPRVVDGILVEKLDEIPPISLDLFAKYKDSMDLSDLPVYLSRGCTYNCSFCTSREVTCGLKRYRVLSPPRATEQIEVLARYHPKRITIQDPLFGADMKWFESFMASMPPKKRDYKVKVEAHVDTLNDRRLESLKRNQIDLTVGFEHASHQQLILMNKTMDPIRYINKMRHIIESFNRSGQELVINILMGFPGETRQTIDDTFGFLHGASPMLDATLLKFSLFRLYPGTPVYEDTRFFKDVFGSVFYMTEWWRHDVDYSLVPSIIDPSRSLDLVAEISYIREKINAFYKQLISRDDASSLAYKLAFTRHMSKVNRSYSSLKDRMASMRSSLSRSKRCDIY